MIKKNQKRNMKKTNKNKQNYNKNLMMQKKKKINLFKFMILKVS